MENYLSLQTLARLLNPSNSNKEYDAIKQRLVRNYYSDIKKENNRVFISINDPKIPMSARVEYLKNQVVETPEPADVETDAEMYAAAPDYNRAKCDKYLSIINAAEGLYGNDLKEFVAAWNNSHPEQTTSYPRLLAARKSYEEQGIAGLLGSYGKNTDSKIDDDDFEYFKSLYLKESRPTLKSCWLSVKGYAIKKAEGVIDENYPCQHSFLRRLKKDIPQQAIYFARFGKAAHYKKFASHLDRNYDEIQAGEVWVSDHRQDDVATMIHIPNDPKSNLPKYLKYFGQGKKKFKPVFAWSTVWRCFKTGKWLGYYRHVEDPNSDHIFQAFYNAASVYGIPKEIILDNGKDYRSKDFAGGRRNFKLAVDEEKTRSLTALLGIKVHFAKPYNAQTKPIERDFKVMKEWLDRSMPGFRGGNVVERPEILEHQIKHNKILDFEAFNEIFDFFVENLLHKYSSEGKNLLGKSRDQAFSEQFLGLKKISADALKLFCLRTSEVSTIRRNGVILNSRYNLYYYAEWMVGLKGKKVYLRRDSKKYQEAWVFDALNHEYLGKATLNAWESDALATTDLAKEKVTELIAGKNREIAIIKSYLHDDKEVDPLTAIQNMSVGLNSQSQPNSETPLNPNIIIKTEMDEVLLLDKEMKSTGTDGINVNWKEKEIQKTKKFRVFDYEDPVQ